MIQCKKGGVTRKSRLLAVLLFCRYIINPAMYFTVTQCPSAVLPARTKHMPFVGRMGFICFSRTFEMMSLLLCLGCEAKRESLICLICTNLF